MLLRPSLRRPRSTLTRLGPLLALILTLWTIADVLTTRRALARSAAAVPAPLGTERVFIASNHWTDERVLRNYWIPAVLALAAALGPANVFVSVYESGSLDDTKGALRDLHARLQAAGIPARVLLDETSHVDVLNGAPVESEGWLRMPRDRWVRGELLEAGKWVPRRIPYLAAMRNRALEPLYELREVGEKFDRVLFLNDVVFDTDDVTRLLDTRHGDYAAACSLDSKHPPYVYDTFALRDADGHAPVVDRWPYFRSRASRDAVARGRPVPVTSCWNGMVAMDAAPFYDRARPLAFRAVADDLARAHVEASECCLVHADNPLSRTKGVFVNPNVRVGYNESTYEEMTRFRERSWLSVGSIARGTWQNRIVRWFAPVRAKDGDVRRRWAAWNSENPGREEIGQSCLVDEMQVLMWNGWAHV